MMNLAAVQVKIIPVQEAWRRSQLLLPHQQPPPPTRLSVVPSTTIPPPGLQIKLGPTPPPVVISSASYGGIVDVKGKGKGKGKGYGNPCLDLYFHLVKNISNEEVYVNELGCQSREYLNELLPAAWSHSPLTTLKLIFNFLDREDYEEEQQLDEESFYTAAYWLHRNHPKTLVSNIPSIARSHFGNFKHLLKMIHRIRLLEVDKARPEDHPDAAAGYLSLHHGISDHLASSFKSFIETLSNKENLTESEFESDCCDCSGSNLADYCMELWFAEDYVQQLRPCMRHHRVLSLSTARKIFFPEESSSYGEEYDQGFDDVDYSSQLLERLEDEILLPLEKLVDANEYWPNCGAMWDHGPYYRVEHLKKVSADAAAAEAEDALALLPHEILKYVTDSELGKAAELQWKIMVEHMGEQGKLDNCLAVFDPRGAPIDCLEMEHTSLALTALISQLAPQPWKGKVISLLGPKLLAIDDQGGHGDLRSKRDFLKGLMDDIPDLGPSGALIDFEFHKVFDLILQLAVDEDLKPNQMIKRVFVFTTAASGVEKWETDDYEAVKSRFKDKGYEEDAVPQLVIWNLAGCMYTTPPRSTQNGLAILSGFHYYVLKTFLDNDGDIGLDHVMEAAISGSGYDELVVVD